MTPAQLVTSVNCSAIVVSNNTVITTSGRSQKTDDDSTANIDASVVPVKAGTRGVTLTVAPVSAVTSWLNTTDGIHLFQTFDNLMQPDTILSDITTQVDYIWGASDHHIAAYRRSKQPGIKLSSYIPYNRDPHARGGSEKGIQNYTAQGWESRILFKCDRKTPAAHPYGDPARVLVPLDITNPEVLEYQVGLAKVSQAAGYDAIGFDNYDVQNNQFEACGVWRHDSAGVRKWVQLYSGKVSGDHAYSQAAVNWLGRIKARINALISHAGKAMMVIPNFSLGSQKWNDSVVLQLGNNTDGILTESGFTGAGGGTSATGPHGPHYVGSEWVQRVLFMRNLQAHGKSYFTNNEYGDYHHQKNDKLPHTVHSRSA